MKITTQGVAKNILIITIMTIISRALGFLRDVLIGAKFGASNQTDAYFVALSIPTILFASIVTALSTIFIPTIIKVKANNGKLENDILTNTILNFVVIVSIIMTVLGMIFTKPIVAFVGGGFSENTLNLTVNLTRSLFPVIILIGISTIFTSILQANNEFTIPSISGIPINIIIIIFLMMSNYLGIIGLVYATIIGTFLQVVIQAPYLRKNGFKYRAWMILGDPNVKNMGFLVVPIIIGIGIDQLNATINRIIASGLSEGSVSALSFAYKLHMFIFSIFILSISTVLYTKLSELGTRHDKEGFKSTLISAMNTITIVMIPIMSLVYVFYMPVTKLIFEHGNFDNHATSLTAGAFLFYSFGLVFNGYREVLNKAFYALNDTKTPMINTSIGLVINIILNLTLVRILQHEGLALANSITVAVIAVLLFINLQRHHGAMKVSVIFSVLLKCFISSIIMSTFTKMLFDMIYSMNICENVSIKILISLVISAIPAVTIYVLILRFLKVSELQTIFQLLRNKFFRQTNCSVT